MYTQKYYMFYAIKAIAICLITTVILISISNNGYAQTTIHQATTQELRANKFFLHLRYIQAIEAYKTVLDEDADNIYALRHLATCYRKINDYVNAEKSYSQLTTKDTLTADNFLYYAQSLSANKKYDLAILAYQKYAALKTNDSRGAAFLKAYGNLSDFYKDSGSMFIELLNINSGQSDFGAAYYKNGLVFCSNRKEGQIVKRVFEWNQSAFLDLYFTKDTAAIKTAKEATDSTINYQKRKQRTNDDDTYPTSNDNGTLGYMNFNYKDTSGMFTKPEASVERFSKALSSKYHEGPVAFFSSQDSLILTRNNYNNGKYREGKDGVNKLKLFSASYKQNDSSWKNVKSLPFNSDNYSTGHPAIAPGDSILYFVSDMPGGYGGTDIYKSYYRNGNWSTPENMGTPMNTEGNEMFPFIDKHNTFYFASDGHPGLGGLDIFTLTKQGAIQNIGYPANSSFDDFGLIIDPKTKVGYFSSNRRRGLGDDDIYRIKMIDLFYIQVIDGITQECIASSTITVKEVVSNDTPSVDSEKLCKFKAGLKNTLRYQITGHANGYASNTVFTTADVSNPLIKIPLFKPQCIIVGTITDKDTKLPVEGARIIIYDITENDTVYEYTVDTTAKYRYVNIKPNHIYSLNAFKEGYFNKAPFRLQTDNRQCGNHIDKDYDYLKDFELEKIVIGRAIKIENIYFDLDKYTIRPKSAKELDKIVKMMQENPNIIIELGSHTDCRSSYKYNITLSDNRAKASANYIISKGISASRITGKGYGESKLVNNCGCEGKVITRKCTEAEHQANRRTEFQVTGFLSDQNTTIEQD